MSYVVHVWEHPEPRTLKNADSLHNFLSSKRSRPNPKWRLLAERVEARMAEIGLPLLAWPDESPPDPNHTERSLPIRIADQGEFLDVLVEVATSLGLSVFDDQAARLYLPFGYMLTWDGLERLQLAPPRLGAADLEDVIAQCLRDWTPRFSERGYVLNRKPYQENERAYFLVAERTVPAGRQTVEIAFNVDTKADALHFSVYAYGHLDLPAAALQAANNNKRVAVCGKELRGIAALLLDGTHEWLPIGGCLRSQPYVDRLVEGLFEYYDEELGPTLDAMRESNGVLRLATGQQDAPGYLHHSRAVMALAWVQGDEVLERLFAKIREHDRDWIEHSGQAVYDALRRLPRRSDEIV
jgi:hypothetical protein